MLTPYDAEARVDPDALEQHLQRIAAFPAAGMYTHGTAGEFFGQTEEEWRSIVTTVAVFATARGIPFQLGAAHPFPVEALRRIRIVRELEPAAIQVILPDWLPPSEHEALRVMEGYAHAAEGVPLVLYMPPHAKRRLSPEELDRLTDRVDAIRGVKLADGDAGWYEQMEPVMNRVAVAVPGHHLATGLAGGAAGSYSNVACFSPSGALAWEQICRQGPARGAEIEVAMARFFEATVRPLGRRGLSSPALDKALAGAGGHLGPVGGMRWPYGSATSGEVRRLRAAILRDLPAMFAPSRDSPCPS